MQRHHVILIDGKASSTVKPYGIEGAFPIADIRYTDTGSKTDLYSGRTFRNCEYPLFTTYDLQSNPNIKFAEGINELNEVLYALRNSQQPTKVNLVSVVNIVRSDKSSSADTWEKVIEQELPDATIHLVEGYNGTYQVKADTAELGTGDKADSKQPINFRDNLATA
jgi:hypothetical protein